MSGIAVFGGTAEGRALSKKLAELGAEVTVFVATSYGGDAMETQDGLTVRQGRLNRDEMTKILKTGSFDAVLDATHPHAAEVTENIIFAARKAGVFYLRIKRGEIDSEGAYTVPDAEAAARFLNETGGKALLTTGSQGLGAFTAVDDFESRLFARVLPDAEVVKKCVELGFRGRNLICMQGPFTHEMNAAMIRMLGVDIVVTKDSGGAGGFPQKLSAARECGVKLIVIKRPQEETVSDGASPDDALKLLTEKLGISYKEKDFDCPRFPAFISLREKNVLIVGGGKIASRRADILLGFGAKITIVSPSVSQEIQGSLDKITWRPEKYGGLDGEYDLVLAATGDRLVNRRVGEDAKKAGVLASVADNREESTFWFPAIAKNGEIVAGIVSVDGNHGAVKKAAAKIRNSLEG